MKRTILFFAVCLGLSVFQTGIGICAETNRAINLTQKTSVSNRQKTEQNRSVANRGTTKAPRQIQNTEQTKSVATRQTAVKNKPVTVNTTQKRIAVVPRTALPSVRSETPRTNAKKATRTAIGRKNISRATTSDSTEILGAKIADIKSKNYTKCKDVYYDCMDEFCANKDANLRRCSCSTRIHEFDTIKKQLDDSEEKMLQFNQRLLLIGQNKEDITAANTASEGELGFSTTDSSASEKLLKKITDNLNNSGDSKINTDLSAISLSLDTDSAWDSVDSLAGVSMTTKNGIALYNSAQPVCIEMAKEVCSDDELDIVQNNYKLAIQQDCNTVAKSYEAKYNQTIEKIHESSALLDMSRLNAYQQRNSDDILTCKKKILDKMYDSAVCGENLHKCLDVTGQYINPADGSAFLPTDLYNIMSLLKAPTTNTEKWSKIPQNEQFVSFLNSKKKFLEPAIEQCQEIADTVWKDFLDDALAQIKLAQNEKLEQIRQSCTTLVTECKSAANQSLEEFDARALSVFKVIADTTVNSLCANVQNSCTSLLNVSEGGTEWVAGITGIATDISYKSILETCMTVGKDCIIQQCNGTSGNFALCGDYSSSQRRAILKRSACWDKVKSCVEQSSNLANITTSNLFNEYYHNIYNIYGLTHSDPLERLCDQDPSAACLITEQIWGNCQYDAEQTSISTNQYLVNNNDDDNIQSENKILIPQPEYNSTLLSWFAYNTGTTDAIDSCSAYNCPTNYTYDSNLKSCKRMMTGNITTSDGKLATTVDQIITIKYKQSSVTKKITNFCKGGKTSKDVYGNCCASGIASNGICVKSVESATYNAIFIQDAFCNQGEETEEDPRRYCEAQYNTTTQTYTITNDKKLSLYCVTESTSLTVDNNGTLICNGYLVLVDQYGNYLNMPGANYPTMSYNQGKTQHCVYIYDGQSGWGWDNNACQANAIPTSHVPYDNEFMIRYEDEDEDEGI